MGTGGRDWELGHGTTQARPEKGQTEEGQVKDGHLKCSGGGGALCSVTLLTYVTHPQPGPPPHQASVPVTPSQVSTRPVPHHHRVFFRALFLTSMSHANTDRLLWHLRKIGLHVCPLTAIQLALTWR